MAYLHTSESIPGSAGAPESHQRPDDGAGPGLEEQGAGWSRPAG